jgi:hypothetical protein
MDTLDLNRALNTHESELPDGRFVTLRRAVPSDAPRLVHLGGGSNAVWGCEYVALDHCGTIVGHAMSASDVRVAANWTASGLRDVLAHEVEEA